MTKVNRKWILMMTAAALLATTTGCSLLPAEDKELKPPLVKPVKPTYETVEVKKGTIIKQVRGVAQFEADRTDYYQFKKAGGRIDQILVSSGDHVKKGQLLVQLEKEGLDLDLKYKQLAYERAKLALRDAVNQKDNELIKVRNMELDIARIEMENSQAKINDKQLIADRDGTVTFVDEVKPGDNVEQYRVLVAVADTTKLRLSYQASNPADLGEVSVGMKADLKINNKSFQAEVVQTPSSAPLVQDEELKQKYRSSLYLKLLSPAPKEVELGTMSDLSIITKKKDNVLILPTRGVRSYLGRTYVQVLDGESRKELDVEIGIKTTTQVEIVSGLKEGQTVILQ